MRSLTYASRKRHVHVVPLVTRNCGFLEVWHAATKYTFRRMVAAALLLNVEGVATLAIAWLAFRENVDRRLLLGAAAILGGAALLSWRGGPSGCGLRSSWAA